MDFSTNIETFLSDNISDTVFIQKAYYYLLGREPDPHGMQHYLSLLHDGADRMSILSSLRFSAEGKRRYKRIKQFDQAIILYKRRSRIRRLIIRLIGRKKKSPSTNIQPLLSAREQVIYLQLQQALHSNRE